MALARIAAMGMGLLGALGASQGPEFAQQYVQRLGGAIDELETVVARFDESAAASGLARDEALARLEANREDLVRSQGENARAVVLRLARLREDAARLAAAGDLGRVVTLARVADPQIARAAYLEYRPAVPVAAEGALAAGLGFMLFWLATFGAAKGAKTGAKQASATMRARRAAKREAKLEAQRRAAAERVYRRES